jgi:uncharacterized protein YigA (DUF484 family)
MDLLSSFIKTASINEDLFNKSKELTLKILGSNSKKEIVSIVESSFSDDFLVDECLLDFYKSKEIDDIENSTGLSLHKGAIHCGSFSNKKVEVLFNDKKIESMVVAVIIVKDEIGLLKLGSHDRTRYLGDEDTTFIRYIRDILEVKLIK